MAPDVTLEECMRLARAMTLKNAAAGLSHGGAKSVIAADPKLPAAEKERLIRAFARGIAELTSYIPGPDMGTDELCMAFIRDEIQRAVGLPAAIGGIPLDEIGATGVGLCAAIDVAKDVIGLDLVGARVAIQGFGAVGMHTARGLLERGARLIAAADSHGTVVAPEGLDVERLCVLKRAGGSVTDLKGARALPADAIVDVECDIWVPAARPDVLNAQNVDRLKARIVAQGANIPATAEAEQRLHARGVLVLPDFIANAGGVICAAVEYHGGTQEQALSTIKAKIADNTRAVLSLVDRDTPPRTAALRFAEARVRAAMAFRRKC
jgi:glutamate dehydrogenase/leucine dehydrogenase